MSGTRRVGAYQTFSLCMAELIARSLRLTASALSYTVGLKRAGRMGGGIAVLLWRILVWLDIGDASGRAVWMGVWTGSWVCSESLGEWRELHGEYQQMKTAAQVWADSRDSRKPLRNFTWYEGGRTSPMVTAGAVQRTVGHRGTGSYWTKPCELAKLAKLAAACRRPMGAAARWGGGDCEA